jgi:glycosyltransferase involved in cell wall biosynthesis/2-polyprenyl-3-methyl-5-hydroxy-6-metoxy-1,4-benzoquinol methylase
MNENLSSDRYEPSAINLDDKNSSQTLIIERTGSHKVVLEIGTSTGYISKILKERGNRVTGIEIDPEAGSWAEQYCERMIIGDVETLVLDEFLSLASFDIIICGDVLEHLKKPSLVLKNIRKFLKPEGHLVVSLPNFCHGDVFLNLLNGDFHYTTTGLLDETHLHFFGLQNIYSVFADSGYQIRDLQTTNHEVGYTELKVDNSKIPPDLLHFIQSLPGSAVYQYIFSAYPVDGVTVPVIQEADLKQLFFNSLQETRKDVQIPLEGKINSLNLSLAERETHIQEKIRQIAELEQVSATRMKQIAGFITQVQCLEQVVTERDHQIADYNSHVLSLEQVVTERDHQIADYNSHVLSLEQVVIERDHQIADDNAQVLSLNAQVQSLERVVTEKDQRITDDNAQVLSLRAQVQSLELELSSIENSIIWQFTMKFHNKVVERLIPQNTRRRRYYDLGRAGGKILIDSGFHAFSRSIAQYLHKTDELSEYQMWIERNEPTPAELIQFKNISQYFAYRPKISILIPVWNTDKNWLRLAIDSVVHQIYDNWELCIVDGGSTNRYIKPILEEYAKKNSRIKVKFLTENKGITGNSNEALSLATGEFIGLLDHDDTLAPHALFEIISLLNQKPNLSLIYTDEDKIDSDGHRVCPFFKPEWSPDLILSCGYINHLTIYRKKHIDRIGGFRHDCDYSQDYDLLLRFLELTNDSEIGHIPKVLYHWRMSEGSSAYDPMAKDGKIILAAKKALQDALDRRGIEGIVLDGLWSTSYRVKRKISGNPKISIIILTKDKCQLLERCIESIEVKSTYKNFEILIVDHESSSPDTLDFLNRTRHRVMRYSGPFNFSVMNNLAVQQTNGDYLLFLNNDTEVISGDWMECMLEHAQRSGVGAVGCKLLFPDRSIQHAGVILGMSPDQKTGVAGHWFKGVPYDCPGYFNLINTIRNYSAVTGACMMISKEKFLLAGGFEPALAVCYNDVDLCLKLRKMNYWNVFTPYAELIHHESVSRGISVSPDEAQYMLNKWGTLIKEDPFYSVNLSLSDYVCGFNYD